MYESKTWSYFLKQCKQEKVFPEFVQRKNIKPKNPLERNRYFTRNLNDAINKRRKELNLFKKEHDHSKEKLLSLTTWMKGQIILFSINRMQSKHCHYIKEKHQKKLDANIVNKTIRDGIKKNPNSIITNLTHMELTESELSVVKYGLKYGLLTIINTAKGEWNGCNWWGYLEPNFPEWCFKGRSYIKTPSSNCVNSFYF